MEYLQKRLAKLLMKNICILFLILLVSCQRNMENKSTSFDLSKRKYFLGTRKCCHDEYMIFEFQTKNNSLKGKVTNIRFIRDSSSILKGTIKDSIIEFTYEEQRIEKAHGIIGNKEIKIKLNDYYQLTLQEIDSSTYFKKYLKAYPKLITLKKDTIIGDYLFEIKVSDWNSRTHYGKSTITIKDKASKKEIQQIKSDAFYFYNKDKLYFNYSEDYNFDHHNDLSFSTGTNGPYMSYSANYYIYDKVEKKFLRNIEYENIANALSFRVDTINKIMISHNRGSSSIHYTDAYEWKNNKIELVKSLTIDKQYQRKVILKKRIHGELKTIIDEPDSNFTDDEMNKVYESFWN